VALQLRKNGIVRVRPLLGGIEAWLALHLPTVSLAPVAGAVALPAGSDHLNPVNNWHAQP